MGHMSGAHLGHIAPTPPSSEVHHAGPFTPQAGVSSGVARKQDQGPRAGPGVAAQGDGRDVPPGGAAHLKPRDADVLKGAVVTRLKLRIREARNGRPNDDLLTEAFRWREALANEREEIESGEREDKHAVALMVLEGRMEEVERQQGTARAALFGSVATGVATPLGHLVDEWLREATHRVRTEVAYRYAVKQLEAWCLGAKVPPTVESVNKRIAARFITEKFIAPGAAPATANKTITALRSYWGWMFDRGHREDERNPWADQSLNVQRKARSGGEPAEDPKRPFTDDEVATLMAGITKPLLADFCRVAALTGMRRDEVAWLRVKHIAGGTIAVPGTKTKNAARMIPIHPDLADLFARRSADKGPEGFIFHELPAQASEARGRGAPISQAFTRTRRALGVNDVPEGSRQSRVDLHSYRRWFIRKAVEALEGGATGFTAWTIADVVGHSKEDGPLPMTMGRYPGPAGREAMRACVEAVRLPQPAPVPEAL